MAKTTTKEKKQTLDITVPGGHIEMIRYIPLEEFRPNPYQPASRAWSSTWPRY